MSEAGFDFIKPYNNVSLEVFSAIVDQAEAEGMPVFGHIPRNFDVALALQGGQDAVVHTEEFFFTFFAGPRDTKNMARDYTPDLEQVPALVKMLLENDVAVIPDLSFTFTNFLMWDNLDLLWSDDETAYLHPETLYGWQFTNINRREEIENFVVRGQWKYNLMQELTRQFEQAGILQVVGTDASAPGLFPGKAVHRELTELVKAGLSNFEALSIGTRNAGTMVNKYVDSAIQFGQIAPGFRADMILVSENPLDDVRNASQPEAVAVNGRRNGVALEAVELALCRRADDL